MGAGVIFALIVGKVTINTNVLFPGFESTVQGQERQKSDSWFSYPCQATPHLVLSDRGM